jgi:hypothetical protein
LVAASFQFWTAANNVADISASIFRSTSVITSATLLSASITNLSNGLTNSDVTYPSNTWSDATYNSLRSSLYTLSDTGSTRINALSIQMQSIDTFSSGTTYYYGVRISPGNGTNSSVYPFIVNYVNTRMTLLSLTK